MSPAGGESQDDRLARMEAALAPVLSSHGLILVDLEWRREGRRQVVRIFVDKPGGVSVADCERLSREVGDLLDVTGLVETAYDLEVSSPGLDRELRSERELAWARGKLVRGFLRAPVGGRTEFTGTLAEVTPDAIVADGEGGRTVVPRALVTRLRLVPRLGERRPRQ